MKRSENYGLRSDWTTSSAYMGFVDTRSYRDSNGDGIGDLPGLVSKLDYLHEIGIGAIIFAGCLQPTDFAYAGTMLTGFCEVDPQLGTLEDFDRLIVEAHKRGIAVVIGWAPYSTHPDHPYFQASRDPNHPKHEEFADYYVWTDDLNTHGFDDWGHWEWDDARKQYFHALWRTTDERWCPETNPYSERMRQENEKVIRFWLNRDIDGFWIDCGGGGGSFKNWKDRIAFEKEANKLIHSYPNKISIAEAGGFQRIERTIHEVGYDSFWCHKGTALGPAKIPVFETVFRRRTLVQGGEESQGIHETLISFYDLANGNRCISEYLLRGPLNLTDLTNVARLKQIFALAATLPVVPMFAPGTECGLAVYSKTYPRGVFQAPMMWSSKEPNYGFTAGEPYVRVNPHNYPENTTVADQVADQNSILNCFRKLMNLRKSNPALQANESVLESYARIPTQDDLRYYAFVRSCARTEQRILVVFNLQNAAQVIRLNFERTRHRVYGKFPMVNIYSGEPAPLLDSNIYSLQLPAHGFAILEMKKPLP